MCVWDSRRRVRFMGGSVDQGWWVRVGYDFWLRGGRVRWLRLGNNKVYPSIIINMPNRLKILSKGKVH